MGTNTRARSNEIAAVARALLDAANPPLNQREPFEALMPLLIEQTGCHPNTARRHIARAMRLKRGEASAAWGGARAGAGNPALKKKEDTMLNDAAKKLVARAARVAAGKGNRDRIALGANTDEIAVEEWETAQTHNPNFREWPSAKAYFDTIFYNEIEPG